MTQMTERWFRFEDVQYSAGVDECGDPLPGPGPVEVHLRAYPVERHTPRGVWLSGIGVNNWHGGHNPQWRFVLRGANKRFACPTREEAMESFVARKRRQIRIHQAAVRRAERAIARAVPMMTCPVTKYSVRACRELFCRRDDCKYSTAKQLMEELV